jgi:glycosyltransferase involved in cell wall biosynthesis
MEISVIVCTRNRAASLRTTLESLARQTMDRQRFEVLVVDNGSTDDTGTVLARTGLDNLRALTEPRVGLSRARNTGVAAATGDVVAFLDDDATAATDWLEAIAASLAHDPGAVTGRVLPIWEDPRPPWLSDTMLPYLSIVDWGAAGGRLRPGEWLCGTNMAIRRRTLVDVGGFPEQLGRIDGKLLSMEEVVVQRRLERRGVSVRYDPALVVHHRVPTARVSPEWLERRAFWQGVSSALCERQSAGALAARPWGYFVGFAGLLLVGCWRLMRRGEVHGLEDRCTALMRAGYVVGWAGIVS